MIFTTIKPTEPGFYLYRENNDIVSVWVSLYKDLQMGMEEELYATPNPPNWGNLPKPFWRVSSLKGSWTKL